MSFLPHCAQCLRRPWRHPGSALLIVATLGIGIGATSSVLSLVQAVLWHRPPFRHPERILVLGEELRSGPGQAMVSSYPNFADWRARSGSFAGMAASRLVSPILRAQGEPTRARGSEVTEDFFPLLGLQPRLGRPLLPGDFQPGAPAVVVLSDRLWAQQLGADPRWLGRTVSLDGTDHTIVGVLPAGQSLDEPLLLGRADLVRPLRSGPATVEASRGNRLLRVIARLREGIGTATAASEMRAIAGALAREHPETDRDSTVRLVPLREAAVGETRSSLLILLGAASLVLLAACTNVANLLLVHTSLRKRELAVRAVLGARRGHLFGQLLVESLGLVVPGALLGFLLTWQAWSVCVSLVPPAVVDLMGVALDGRALAVTLLVSSFALVMINLIPWLALPETCLVEVLTEDTPHCVGARGRHLTRGLVVAAETALALVLLIGAGLLIKSFLNLSRAELGFRAEKRLVLDLELPMSRYGDPARAQSLFEEIFRRVESHPGVRKAGLTVNFPLSTGLGPREGALLDWSVDFHGVSPCYFPAMGIPILSGRDFSPRDGAQNRGVVIVNASTARRLWPGEEAVGKELFLDWSPPNPRQVIGVVGDIRGVSNQTPPHPEVYLPYQQLPFWSVRLVVNTDLEPLRVAPDVRRQIRSIDKSLPIVELTTMEQLLAARIEKPKIYARILATFAVLALVLMGVGVYAVTAFAVAARRREIGVRIALGARSRDVFRLFLVQGGWWVVLGLVAGVAGAYGLSRWLASLLFEVSSLDAVTFLFVPALLAAAGFSALVAPVRKSSTLDPVKALKEG
jgi:putative ABC transport system permease protein